METELDFDRTPLLAIWETTRSCALACRHCRAEAIDKRHPGELSTAEGQALLGEVRAMGTPLVVLTGGDPLQRPDLEALIAHGKGLGLRVGAIPATTPLLTRERVRSLKAAGLDQMAVSLDAAEAAAHDDFRQVPGCFAKALAAAEWAREEGLRLQVNSVFTAANAAAFPALADLVTRLGVVFWEVFLLVPTGRGAKLASCSTAQYWELFAQLYELASRVSFIVKITEAPQYRAYSILRQRREGKLVNERPEAIRAGVASAHHRPHGGIRLPKAGVNSGKGFVFIDHLGEVCPSGFLPLPCGNVRQQSLGGIYREAPLFRELRDSRLLKGWCGRCEFKDVCGGSRARAYALSGDYLAQEPYCQYGQELAATGAP